MTIQRTRENILEWRRANESRERLLELEHELGLASRMQRSILPTEFPREESHDVHGSMTPAHEVSGDFFDVIRLDGGRTGLAIADVSGKGVPAALFMMSSRTLLKGAAIGLGKPELVLREVNNLLHRDNESTMFVTMLYSVYDPATGTLTYANGGHCRPLLVTPEGRCEELPATRGIALGLMPDREYREVSIAIPPGGDAGHVHRRGIGGDERGRRGVRHGAAGAGPGGPARGGRPGDQPTGPGGRQGLHRRRGAVRRHHVPDAAPEGRGMTGRTVRLEFDPGGNGAGDQDMVLRRISDAVAEMARREGWEDETAFRLNLILEEVSLNVMMHGGEKPGTAPGMEITMGPEGGGLAVEISDSGRAFNPLTDGPAVTLPVPGRPVDPGGLGLHLIRSMASSVCYRHTGGMNRLRVRIERDGV